MSSVTSPRGPLPARVYWTRRVLALVVVLGLVFGIGRLVGATGSDPGPASARPAAAEAGWSAPSPAPTLIPSPDPTQPSGSDPDAHQEESNGEEGSDKQGSDEQGRAQQGGDEEGDDRRDREPERTPLAAPTGPCLRKDILVSPSLAEEVYAYRDTAITLELTTVESPACTWEVSADSLVLRITSGSDRIWTTQDCEEAVPDASVVVRKDLPAQVEVTWSGLRSEEECTRSTPWAEPGYYHATAAALGGGPTDVQFELQAPEPKPEKGAGGRAGRTQPEERDADRRADGPRTRGEEPRAAQDRKQVSEEDTRQARKQDEGPDEDRDGGQR